MHQEIGKTIEGFFAAICSVAFTTISLTTVDTYVRITAGILGAIASVYVILYYRKQLNKNK